MAFRGITAQLFNPQTFSNVLAATQAEGGRFTGPQGNTETIHIGLKAGESNQGLEAVAVGLQAGQTDQGRASVAIGSLAGCQAQGRFSVAYGVNCARNNQGVLSVATGAYAGCQAQTQYAVAVGGFAGYQSQGEGCVAIGANAGQVAQRPYAVAIGIGSGFQNQSESAVGVGLNTGFENQGSQAVAMGYFAGYSSQGSNAIAIGTLAGHVDQPPNSICLNAQSDALNPATSGFFVKPVRQVETVDGSYAPMFYDPSSGEIVSSVLLTSSLSTQALEMIHPADDLVYHECVPITSDGHGREMMCKELVWSGETSTDTSMPVRTIHLRDPVSGLPWYGRFNISMSNGWTGTGESIYQGIWTISKSTVDNNNLRTVHSIEGDDLTRLYVTVTWDGAGYPVINMFNKTMESMRYLITGIVFPLNNGF